ncbi:MAG: hypothetical protein U0R64_01710 [Candidatus Nanopelagicales bacterium]
MNRRIPALVAIAAAGLTVAGCSATTTSSPSSTPADTSVPVTSASPAAFLVQAADATAATGSAKISATSTISGIAPGDGGPLTVTANGVVDFADSEASLQVDSALFGAAGGPSR